MASGLLVGLHDAHGTPVQSDPAVTAAIVGGSGSGRSTMLATRVARLASLGVRVAVVAPYWSGTGWFRGVGGRAIRIGPTSTWHHDPLALRGRLPDERADELRPIFMVLLGEKFDALADDIIRAALLEFYATGSESGMAGLVSVLALMEHPMTPVAARKRDEIGDILELVAVRGPLARYFTLPADPLPDDLVRRLLIHPEPSADPLERGLLACLALSAATDTLAAGPGPGSLAVDDIDTLLGAATEAVDDALVSFTRIGRQHGLSLSMTLALASTTRAGWHLPRILALTSSWIFLSGDYELVRGWSLALPYPVDPNVLADALAERNGERRAALVERGEITVIRPVLLPGEEDILGGPF